MEASEEEVHPEEGEDHRPEPHDGHYRCLPAPPPDGQALMQQGSVDQPGYEGPGLLRVPAPVAPPGVTGPDGAGDYPYAQQGKSYGEAAVIYLIEDLQGGEPSAQGAEPLVFQHVFLNQVHHTGTEGEGKGAIS